MSWCSRSRVRAAALVWTATLALVPPVRAQTAPAGWRRRDDVELAGGVGWLGPVALGDRDAELRANSTIADPYRLFSSETRVGGAPFFDARVGVALSRRYVVEGRVAYSRSELATTVSADVEQARPLTAVESVGEYLVEGGVAVRLTGLAFARVLPFAAAGAGYTRGLHDGRAFIEEGRAYYVGGGVRRTFFTRVRGGLRSAGWRVDGRLYLQSGGLSADEGVRVRPAVGASVFVSF